MKYLPLTLATLLVSVATAPLVAQQTAAEVIAEKTNRGLPSDDALTSVANKLAIRAATRDIDDSTRRAHNARVKAARIKHARIKAARIKAAREDAAGRDRRVRPHVSVRPTVAVPQRRQPTPASRPAQGGRPNATARGR